MVGNHLTHVITIVFVFFEMEIQLLAINYQ